MPFIGKQASCRRGLGLVCSLLMTRVGAWPSGPPSDTEPASPCMLGYISDAHLQATNTRTADELKVLSLVKPPKTTPFVTRLKQDNELGLRLMCMSHPAMSLSSIKTSGHGPKFYLWETGVGMAEDDLWKAGGQMVLPGGRAGLKRGLWLSSSSRYETVNLEGSLWGSSRISRRPKRPLLLPQQGNSCIFSIHSLWMTWLNMPCWQAEVFV